MKTRIFAASLLLAGAAFAQTQEAPKQDQAPAEVKAAEPAAPSEAGKVVRIEVTGLNDWSGYIQGTAAADSKLSKIQIGMTPAQVRGLIGPEHRIATYPTGKRWIPFYRGSGRWESIAGYNGVGRIRYASDGGMARTAEPSAVIGIEHDANEGK